MVAGHPGSRLVHHPGSLLVHHPETLHVHLPGTRLRTPSRNSPCTPSRRSPYTPSRKSLQIPPRMSGASRTASPVTGCEFVETGMRLRRSPFRSPASIGALMATPQKDSSVQTPVKGVLLAASRDPHRMLESPSRTPRKCVTWSPPPQKLQSEAFKVTDSPCLSSRSSPMLLKTPIKFSSPSSNLNVASVFKTPEKSICSPKIILSTIPESPRPKTSQTKTSERSSERLMRKLSTPGKVDSFISPDTQNGNTTALPDHYSTQDLPSRTPQGRPASDNQILTRSRGTPAKEILTELQFLTPGKIKATPKKRPFKLGASGETSDRTHCESALVASSSCSPKCKTVTRGISKQHLGLQTIPTSNCDQISTVGQNQGMQSSLLERELVSGSVWTPQSVCSQRSQQEADFHSESQQLDSTQGSIATTEDDSIDICNATVVKTQLSEGIKMSVSFSRKSSKSSKAEVEASPPPSSSATAGRTYGFRRTAERQQRAAAARLGSPEAAPKSSTPCASQKFSKRQNPHTPDTLTYQVELEMQASGLPKLKFKRTDSFSALEDPSECSTKARSHGPLNVKPQGLTVHFRTVPSGGMQAMPLHHSAPTQHLPKAPQGKVVSRLTYASPTHRQDTRPAPHRPRGRENLHPGHPRLRAGTDVPRRTLIAGLAGKGQGMRW
ncbi:hypothetical protein AAFF_G00105530 [Aldrovandia affinis]|uniref:Uncharacterized protein n=1 Tax=Aldrovandia affinis TaxID=143900 RepID=A0AAD7T3V7_9TELE|nr:hypothetical protein AAFF_G00105530 [Aldrovandia affinis]